MVEMQGSDQEKDLGLDNNTRGQRTNFWTSKSYVCTASTGGGYR